MFVWFELECDLTKIDCFIFSGWLVDITSGYNSMFYMATALKFSAAGCALALYLILRMSPL